jgi:hypothetical protein
MTLAVMSRGAMTFERFVLARVRLHESTPGEAHIYARVSDRFPEHVTRMPFGARRARLEDRDGNWLGAMRPVELARRLDPVMAAVKKDRVVGESIPERSHSAALSVLIVGRAVASAIREFSRPGRIRPGVMTMTEGES